MTQRLSGTPMMGTAQRIKIALAEAKAERTMCEAVAAYETVAPKTAEEHAVKARQLCTTIFHLEKALESLTKI